MKNDKKEQVIQIFNFDKIFVIKIIYFLNN